MDKFVDLIQNHPVAIVLGFIAVIVGLPASIKALFQKNQTATSSENNYRNFLLGNEEYSDLQDQLKDRKDLFEGESDPQKRLRWSEEVNSLEKKIHEYEKNLKKHYDSVLGTVYNTQRSKEAGELFLSGNMAKADKLLDEESMAQKGHALMPEIETEDAGRKLESLALEFRLKAKIWSVKHQEEDWLEKTISYYREALKYHRENREKSQNTPRICRFPL